MTKTITKTIRVAGVFFQRETLLGVTPSGKCTIRHDPMNRYDPKCLDIMWGDVLLGHIPKGTPEQNAILASLQAGRDVKCKTECIVYDKPEEVLKTPEIIDVEVTYEMEEQPVFQHDFIVKKSTTEPKLKVEFAEVPHTYTEAKSRKILTGGTTKIKRFVNEFDSKRVSKSCAKLWGVSQKELLSLWDRKGDDASDFGTVIHNALETFALHGHLGDIIHQKSEKKVRNDALPSHPALRKIVLEHIALAKIVEKKYGVTEVVPEALVTDFETLSCGLVDRLLIIDRKKKICRIGDYKANINVEEEDYKYAISGEFKHLPMVKLSKFVLQLSFYAWIMQKHGWTVLGGDAYVYGEDGWWHYPLELVDMDEIFNPK